MCPEGLLIEAEYGNNMGTWSACVFIWALFSLKPLCGSVKSIAGPLNSTQHSCWYHACTRGPLLWALTVWVSQEKLGELAKRPQILKIVSLWTRFSVWDSFDVCVLSPEHENTWSVLERVTNCGCWECACYMWCKFTCTYACVCGNLLIFYWFIEPHESFFALDEIVCCCHYKRDQNMLEKPLLLWFLTDPGPDFTSLTSGCKLWRCVCIAAS